MHVTALQILLIIKTVSFVPSQF